MKFKCKNCSSDDFVFDAELFENICSKCGVVEAETELLSTAEADIQSRHHEMMDHVSINMNKYTRNKTSSVVKPCRSGTESVVIDKYVNGNSLVTDRKMNYYVNLFSDRLGLTGNYRLKTRAMDIYMRFKSELERQRPRKSDGPKTPEARFLAPVCIYIAIKEYGIPKSFREIQRIARQEGVTHSRLGISNFLKLQTRVQEALRLDHVKSPDKQLPMVLASSFAKQLGLALKTELKAIEVLNTLKDELWFTSHSPNDIAICALWFAYYRLKVGYNSKRKSNVSTQRHDCIHMDSFVEIAKANFVTARVITKIIADSYAKVQKKKAKDGQEREILVSVPQFGSDRKAISN